jgi:hypothetical protein
MKSTEVRAPTGGSWSAWGILTPALSQSRWAKRDHDFELYKRALIPLSVSGSHGHIEQCDAGEIGAGPE